MRFGVSVLLRSCVPTYLGLQRSCVLTFLRSCVPELLCSFVFTLRQRSVSGFPRFLFSVILDLCLLRSCVYQYMRFASVQSCFYAFQHSCALLIICCVISAFQQPPAFIVLHSSNLAFCNIFIFLFWRSCAPVFVHLCERAADWVCVIM